MPEETKEQSGAGTAPGSTGGDNPSPTAAPQPPEGGAAPQASTEGGGATGSPTPQGSGGPAAGAVPPPAFTPNFKLSVMDQEYEIPEFARTLMKDEQSEKQVREVFEKAFGLDVSKPKYQAAQDRIQQYDRGLEKLQNWSGEKATSAEFEQFLGFFKIPKERLFKYVAEQLQYEELSPEERQRVDQARQRDLELDQLRNQNQGFQRQAVAQRERELETAISREDISGVAGEFDKRQGKGSFRALVIRQAQAAYSGMIPKYRRGTDLSVEEAVQDVMGMLGYELQEVQDTPPKVVAPATQKNLPVLPNVGGSPTASPLKSEITSMDQLRSAARQIRGVSG